MRRGLVVNFFVKTLKGNNSCPLCFFFKKIFMKGIYYFELFW